MVEKGTIFFGLRLLWGKVRRRGYPFLVQLNVTNRCNARCTYCYARYYSRSSQEMTLVQIREVVDRLHRAGTFRINLVGGEPLLRSDIGEIITYVRDKGIHCAMTTNGSLASRMTDSIRNLNLVCFSVDGRPGNHDRCRGEGSHEKTLEGLRACREAGVPVQLSSVITRHTAEDVNYMVSIAEEFGGTVGFSVLIGQKSRPVEGDPGDIPSDAQVRNALKRIIQLKSEGKPILFSRRSYQQALGWPDFTREVSFDEDQTGSVVACHAGRCFCLVDYNGDVYPCPQLLGRFKPRNLFRDGFASAFLNSSEHGCKACAVPCSIDFNLFFSLDPSVMKEHLLTYGKRSCPSPKG